MTHSLVLLLVLIGAGSLASKIPTALLAGILIKVGLDIIDWGFLLRAHRLSGKTAVLMYGVLLMTVFWDLIWGVLVGMFVANLLTVDSITQVQLAKIEADNPVDGPEKGWHPSDLNEEEKQILSSCQGQLMLFRLSGPLSFGAAKGISARMGLVQNYTVIVLDITDVPRMGVSASLAIERIAEEAASLGRTTIVAGAIPAIEERLRRLGVTNLQASRREALQKAYKMLTSSQGESS